MASGIENFVENTFAPFADSLNSIIFFGVDVGGQEFPLIVAWLIVAISSNPRIVILAPLTPQITLSNGNDLRQMTSFRVKTRNAQKLEQAQKLSQAQKLEPTQN